MIRNFFRVALRNLYQQKLFAGFNLLGISMGLACCIVVYLLIQHQLHQDAFHRNAASIFIVNHVRTPNGQPELWGPSPAPVGTALQTDLAEIERMVRFHGAGAVVKYGNNAFNEYIRMADPDFFEMFSFPLQAGHSSALKDPSAIILSDGMARKYFGEQPAVGKQLTVLFNDQTRRSFTVRGVAAPFPNTTSFAFDLLVNYGVGEDLGWRNEDWNRQIDATFIQLSSPDAAGKVTKSLSKYVERHNAINRQSPITAFYLDNLLGIAQHAHNTRHSLAGGTSPTGLIVLGALAVLILFMACFNFMNYTIATSTSRFKEIGVRKVLGSNRQQLILQFIGENLLTGFMALVVALLLADALFLPTFTRLIDVYQLRFNLLEDWRLVLFLLALLAGTALLSGLYPSLYISGFNPVTVLKGNQRIKGTNGLVRTLLVVQLGLSMFTVAASILTTQNARFIRNMNVGYDQSQLLVLRANSEGSFRQLRNAAARLPQVTGVAGSQDQIGRMGAQASLLEFESNKLTAEVMRVSTDYIRTLGFTLVEGRNFLPDSPTDAASAIIVNQALVRAMGWERALGKQVRLQDKSYQIVGVVKDFNYRAFFHAISPCVLKLNAPSDNRILTLKVNTEDTAQLQAYLKGAWQKAMPDVPFEISRQKDVYSDSFDESRRVTDVFTYVAVLTLIISAMGLFAIVSLRIARKTKEIGIRKVLGASSLSIAGLINREFLVLITLAGAIFLPLAFFVLKNLLDSEYAYHIPVTGGAFIGTLAVMLLLALIMIGTQVYKIATANPVKALRTE
jgi:ABC-type antimicrobial peptide transport system permease subunit